MKTETKILGGILIGTALLLFGGIFFLTKISSQSSQVFEIDYSKGQRIGSDSARVKLVEFSDFQCPACRAVEPYLQNIRVTYPNDVLVIYRHFPLAQHKYARPTATLAEAAGEQGKFWPMHDRIFETQDSWKDLPNGQEFFLDLAKGLELDNNKIKEALDKDLFRAKIDEDFAEGKKLGVNSTPTFFLNGRKLKLKSFEELNSEIEKELKK